VIFEIVSNFRHMSDKNITPSVTYPAKHQTSASSPLPQKRDKVFTGPGRSSVNWYQMNATLSPRPPQVVTLQELAKHNTEVCVDFDCRVPAST